MRQIENESKLLSQKEITVQVNIDTDKLGKEGMVCAAQHIKTFFKQCARGEIADWGEPCSDCINIETCNLDWLAKLKPLFKESGVPIRLGYAEHADKLDNHFDRGNHQ